EGVSTGGVIIAPEKAYATVASEGALVNVPFSRNFEGEYSLEFTFNNLFPMRYRLEWRANSRPSGLFAVYVNDVELTFEDKFGNIYTEFDTYDLRESVISVTGDRFLPEGGFNMRDYWVENLTEYGDVKVRFEYRGPGGNNTNGLNIDYVKLIPEQ
ncbi:MAG: hypothetical protein QNK35_09215, partial [Bacteroides sp.]|nr:hypothetical protein [Bacteroides sp.]